MHIIYIIYSITINIQCQTNVLIIDFSMNNITILKKVLTNSKLYDIILFASLHMTHMAL